MNPQLVTAAQDDNFYYYSDGRKNPLVLSKEKLTVRFKQGVSLNVRETVINSEQNIGPFFEREESLSFRLTFLPLREGLTEADVIQTLNSLNRKPEVDVACPMFEFPNCEAILTDEFVAKFEPNVSPAEIDAFNALNDVEIARKLRVAELY